MRVLEVFKARHKFAREIFFEDLFDRYSETQLRTPPHPSMNSLIWIIWHVARIEDTGIARFVTGEEQIINRAEWDKKLNVGIRHNGFGATRDEVLTISGQIDFHALRGYQQAVIDYTMDSLDKLTPETLDEVLSEDEVRRILVDEGIGHPQVTEEAIPIYTGWTRLEALYHFSVTHYYWHGGEVRTLEGFIKSNT